MAKKTPSSPSISSLDDSPGKSSLGFQMHRVGDNIFIDLVIRIVVFRQVTTLMPIIISNCTSPNITLVPECPPSMMLMGSSMLMENPRALSERGNNQTGELANGLESPQ